MHLLRKRIIGQTRIALKLFKDASIEIVQGVESHDKSLKLHGTELFFNIDEIIFHKYLNINNNFKNKYLMK